MTLELEPKPPKHPNAKHPDECEGCDKENHAARSAYWQPNHLDHKKHERGYKEWESASYDGVDEQRRGE